VSEPKRTRSEAAADRQAQTHDKAERSKDRERARAKGQRFLPQLVDYWIEVASGLHASASHADRIRAGENVANRCGLPLRTELSLGPTRLKVKLVEVAGWRDAQGRFHTEDESERERGEPNPNVKAPPFIELDPHGNGGDTIQ
jgi:hypothetical protein